MRPGSCTEFVVAIVAARVVHEVILIAGAFAGDVAIVTCGSLPRMPPHDVYTPRRHAHDAHNQCRQYSNQTSMQCRANRELDVANKIPGTGNGGCFQLPPGKGSS